MSPSFRIRRGTRADLKWIAEAQVTMAMESEGMRLDPPTVRRGVKKVLENPIIGQYWIVFTPEREAAGMCLTLSEWSDWRCKEVLWIHSVYTEARFRKQGVYRALYTHLQKKVRASKKYGGLRLYVDRKNHAAKTVYRNLGMHDHHYELFEWMKDR